MRRPVVRRSALRRVSGGRGPVRGISLVEVLVAVMVSGILGTLLMRALVGGQRIHRAHLQEISMNESARAALAILPAELRELSAGGGDVLAMDSSAIVFNAMRGLYLLCADPDTVTRTVLLDGRPLRMSEPIGVPDDSLLLFTDRDPGSRQDDAWIRAGASGAESGSDCPGSAPSLAVSLTGVTGAQLAGARAGAPLRAFRPAQVLAYRDAGGDWWLGERVYQASSGSWSTVQPVLGPIAAGGLVLTYHDVTGHATARADAVARIGVRVVARSPDRAQGAAGGPYLVREAATEVGLRNNPRY